MCGIAGFIGNKNRKLLLTMIYSIKHRGPDEKIIYEDSFFHAGMQRLTIIDLKKNIFPMHYSNLVLLYNGEVYNFKFLKKDLQKKGIKFKTRSDAEVILPLFKIYGYKAFNMLDGMFSIMIYDRKHQRLYLARDKFGEKPLYFYHQGKKFAFASEIKALLPLLKNKQINSTTLASYLFQGHAVAPKTIIKSILKIPPASLLTLNIKTMKKTMRRYYSPIIKRLSRIQSDKLIKKLDFLLENGIKIRLMSDVPVGCFLSGGVDSSLITYYASKYIKNIPSYSISFPEFPKYDETKYAKLAAKICSSKHIIIPCTAKNIRPIINNIGLIVDEPIIDAAFLPLFLLAQEARKKVKVILTGDGGDELFAGYQRYQKEIVYEKIRKLLNFTPVLLSVLNFIFLKNNKWLLTPINKHYSPQRLWQKPMIDNLLRNKPIYNVQKIMHSKTIDSLTYMQKTDLKGYLAEQLLMKTDKATMFNGLEARLPYLNPVIVNFAFSLPTNLKTSKLQGKYLLKRVAAQYFPKQISWRKKHGFSVPLNFWFRNELKDIVWDSYKDLELYTKLFNYKYYKFIIQEHLEGKKNWADQIWGLIVLTKFLKYHKFNIA